MPTKKTAPPEIEPVEPVAAPLPAELPAPAPAAIAPIPPAPLAPPPPPVFPQAITKPGKIQAIAILTLISGIVSIFYGLIWTISLLATIICWPIGAYPITLGVLEIIYAAKLLGSNPRNIKPATYLAVMEICEILFFNPFSLTAGILALVFYNDPEVKAYFARINGQA
ncbi:MAG: hypothetical protein FD146_1618 [Anaerolineaceae bacterium]|nr:MAG: hypothetical protein FD146_1618 [Anaerolineaceae bacterium]